jgi:hypothetical protein
MMYPYVDNGGEDNRARQAAFADGSFETSRSDTVSPSS